MSHVLHASQYLTEIKDRLAKFVNERELRSVDRKLPQAEQDAETTDGYVEEKSVDGGTSCYFLEIDSHATGVQLQEKCVGLQAKSLKTGITVKYIVYSNARARQVSKVLGTSSSKVQVIVSFDSSKT